MLVPKPSAASLNRHTCSIGGPARETCLGHFKQMMFCLLWVCMKLDIFRLMNDTANFNTSMKEMPVNLLNNFIFFSNVVKCPSIIFLKGTWFISWSWNVKEVPVWHWVELSIELAPQSQCFGRSCSSFSPWTLVAVANGPDLLALPAPAGGM